MEGKITLLGKVLPFKEGAQTAFFESVSRDIHRLSADRPRLVVTIDDLGTQICKSPQSQKTEWVKDRDIMLMYVTKSDWYIIQLSKWYTRPCLVFTAQNLFYCRLFSFLDLVPLL